MTCPNTPIGGELDQELDAGVNTEKDSGLGWVVGHAADAPHNVVKVLARHTASGLHGKTYEHMKLLRYDEVVKARS